MKLYIYHHISIIIISIIVYFYYIYIQSIQWPPTVTSSSSFNKKCIDPTIPIKWESSSSLSSSNNTITTSIDTCNVVSWTYLNARTKFKYLSNQIHNVQYYSIPITKIKKIKTTATTTTTTTRTANNNNNNIAFEEEEEVLTIDIAIIPGSNKNNNNKKNTIVHSSGTHGIEGYAGSMIQIAFLQLILENQNSSTNNTSNSKSNNIEFLKFENRPTIILIHAINPYGMYYYRRVNEHNIDLNRNAIIPPITTTTTTIANQNNDNDNNDDKKQTSSSPYTPFYNVLTGRPPPPTTTTTTPSTTTTILSKLSKLVSLSILYKQYYHSTIGMWFQFIPLLLRHGYITMKRALVNGQYEDPIGPFYGGIISPTIFKNRKMEYSLQKIIEFINTTTITTSNNNNSNNSNDTHSSSNTTTTNTNNNTNTNNILNDINIWIDIHTGLGIYGFDTILATSSTKATTKIFPNAYKIITPNNNIISNNNNNNNNEKDNNNILKGYEETKGVMTDYLLYLQQQQQQKQQDNNDNDTFIKNNNNNNDGIFVAQEFGTLPGILVGRSLILENQMFHHTIWNNSNNNNEKENENENNTNNYNYNYYSYYPISKTIHEKQFILWGQSLLQFSFIPNSYNWRKHIIQRGLYLLFDSIDYTIYNQ